MSMHRRGTFRKTRSNGDKENGKQSISNFTQKRPREECVEIVIEEDDEKDQFVFDDPTPPSRPLSLRRRKKHIILDQSDEEDNETDKQDIKDMEEDEELKEAMRQSRLQLEKDVKRRAICNMFGTEIQSSPTSSGNEIHEQERPESPDLFGTPSSSNKDKTYDTPDDSTGLKNVCVSDNGTSKSPLDKEINIKITPLERSASKRTFSLKKKKDSIQNQSSIDFKKEKQNTPASDSKKRKHIIEDESEDDDFDGDKEHSTKSVPTEPKKKQRTIEDNFPPMKSERRVKIETEAKHVIIDDDEEDKNIHDENESSKTRSEKLKKYFRVRLERTYKKPRLPIKTIQDAVNSRLFFAPPGIDHKLYTYAIIKMLDHTRECIRKAQLKSLQFVKWGLPIVTGPRVENTLDVLKKEKNKRTSNPVLTADEPMVSRRSLRSSNQTKVISPPERAKEKPKATESQPHTTNTCHSDSDSSDEGLSKSVFSDYSNKPNNWKEYSDRSENTKFGENIITSVDFNQGDFTEEKKSVAQVGGKFGKEKNPDLNGERNKTIEHAENVDQEVDSQTFNSQKTFTNYNKERSFCENENTTYKIAKKSKELQETSEQSDSSVRKSSQDLTQLSKELEVDNEEIDSSNEIGRKKTRHGRNIPVIDEEEVSSNHSADVEMIDIGHYSSSDSDEAKKSESTRNAAGTSGFLKVKRDSITVPVVQRKVTMAARKAAEAAGRRLQKSNTATQSNSQETTSSVGSPQVKIYEEENAVECPICYGRFSLEDIELHAASCNGSPSCSNQEVDSGQQSSASTCTDPAVQQKQSYDLKKLQVVVVKSPEAQRRLQDRNDLASSRVKRNLSLQPHDKLETGRHDDQGTRYIDMVSDQEETAIEDEARVSHCELDPQTFSQNIAGVQQLRVLVSQSPKAQRMAKEQNNFTNSTAKRNLSLSRGVGNISCPVDVTDDPPRHTTPRREGDSPISTDGSQRKSWLSSESAEKKKKEKFKVTYGIKKKTATTRHSFTTLDFIPLEENGSSCDSEDDISNKRGQVGSLRNTTTNKEQSASISSPKAGICAAKPDVDSDSKFQTFACYGGQQSERTSQPKWKELTSKFKKTSKEDFDEKDYANEMALMELSGMSVKRPRAENQSKSSKRRRKRATISSDDSDENDDYAKCYMCDQRVLKESYKKHTDSCMKQNPTIPGKTTAGDIKAAKTPIRKSPRKSAKPTTSSNTVEMDSDEIGDSPIKTFKLIGDQGSNIVDFDNQFAHFGNGGKSTKSSSKRGSKISRGRGRGRGKGFKKKPWYKKSYRK